MGVQYRPGQLGKGSPSQLWLGGRGVGWSQAHVTVGQGRAGGTSSDLPVCLQGTSWS